MLLICVIGLDRGLFSMMMNIFSDLCNFILSKCCGFRFDRLSTGLCYLRLSKITCLSRYNDLSIGNESTFKYIVLGLIGI